jgi:MFS family permease
MYITYRYTKEIANFMGMESLMPVLILLGAIGFIFASALLFTWPQVITMGADYSIPKSRGRIMAIQGMIIGMAPIVTFGLIGQLPRVTGILPLFYLGAFFALVCLLLTRIGLVEKLPEERLKKKTKTFGDIKELFQVAKKSLELKAGYLCILSARADIGIISGFLIIWMVTICQDYGYTAAQATSRGAIALAISSVAITLITPFLGIMQDKWGRVPTTIVCLAVGGAALSSMALVDNPFSKPVWFIYIFIGVAFAGALAPQTLIADSAPPHLRGTAMGVLNTAMAVGGIVFMQLGGFLFDHVGYAMPFVAKGIANIAVAVWMFSIRKRIKDLGGKPGHPGHH